MVEIPLSQGKIALIDDDDAARVLQYKWHAYQVKINGKSYGWYARTTINGKQVHLHRFIMEPPDGTEVDHADGDGLNCRRYNMRVCTHAQNLANQKTQSFPGKYSQYRGVTRPKDRLHQAQGTWWATIKVHGKRVYLGHYDTEIEAAQAYNVAAAKFFGEYARPNVIEKGEQ